MPTYPPRKEPIRKVEILNRKVLELKKYAKGNYSPEKVLNSVERVRIAYLNVLKAKLALNSPFKKADDTEKLILLRNRIESEINKWNTIEVDEILEYYKIIKN